MNDRFDVTQPADIDAPPRRVDINLSTLHWQTNEERISTLEVEIAWLREWISKHINLLHKRVSDGQA